MEDGNEKDIKPGQDNIRKNIVSFYQNEQELAMCNNERTGANLVKANLTSTIRLLSSITNKTLTFLDKDGKEKEFNGCELAEMIKKRKANVKRIYPRQEAGFDVDYQVRITRFYVGEDVVATAHTKSRISLEMADDKAQDKSWGEYRKQLEEILDDAITFIMELEPSLLPWKKNVRSDDMDLEDIMKMSGDEELIEM